jgi:hypothetical protein
LALNLKNDPQAIEKYNSYHQKVSPEAVARLYNHAKKEKKND